jgi:hypothetical protein
MTETLSKFIPVCVAYDPFQVRTISDVRYILQHEIDLFEEGEDAALSPEEIGKVRVALRRASRPGEAKYRGMR